MALGLPAICIEMRRIKGATAAMAVKTDRNDARAIAQAMRVGWFTAVHLKTWRSQELRMLLTHRKALLSGRLAIENEICDTLKAFGLKVGPVTADAFKDSLQRIVADAGYKGHNALPRHKLKVYTSGQKQGVTSSVKRDLRRRAAVEPVIGRLKAEHRMGRSYLPQRSGDADNAVLAAAASTSASSSNG